MLDLIESVRTHIAACCVAARATVPEFTDGEILSALVMEAFDPSEKRDDSGKWTSGGGGGNAGRLAAGIKSLPLKFPGGNPNNRKVPFEVDEEPPYLGAERPADDEITAAPISQLRLDGLIATQKTINAEKVSHLDVDSDEPILVVRAGGKQYIDDGTHHATARKVLGHETIRARILDYDAVSGKLVPSLPPVREAFDPSEKRDDSGK